MRARPIPESAIFPCRCIAVVLPLLSLTLAAPAPPAGASVGFSCDFPGSDPAHYAISVSADGQGNYSSNGKLSRDSESESFNLVFTAPQATVAHIFELAQKAHYFEGNIDAKRKNIASTGEKTLTYADD